MADLALNITARNQAQAVLNSLGSGLEQVAAQAKTAQQSLKAMGDGMVSAGTKLTAGVTAPILGFAAAAIKGAAEQEQLEVSFTTMLGSAEKAKTMMADLSAFAASTPFESPEIQNASKMLLAFGVDAEQIIPTMTNLGDIAAGLNIPIGDMAYLFGTTKAAGRMMTADLNQFTSRGIPMIAALAETMGIAESEVKAAVEAGKVGFPEMEAALTSLTAEGGQFSGLMAAQSMTLAGLFSTLSDNVGLSLAEIGKVIIETFDLKTKLAGAIEWLVKAKDAMFAFAKSNPQMFKLGIIIAAVAAAIGPLLIGLGMLVTWMAAAMPVIGAVGAALGLLVSPIALVAAAIGALLYFDVGGVRTAISGVVSAFNEYRLSVLDAGFGSTETQETISLFPSFLQPTLRFVDQTIGAFREYRLSVLDAGFGSTETQEVISLFPESLQSIVGAVDQTIGAFREYRLSVLDAGFGSTETQEVISLFPESLQSTARFIDQTIGAFREYRLSVLDAGYGSTETQEVISLFPESLQGTARFLDQTIGAFREYRLSVIDAGLGSTETQEVISLFPASLQGVARAADAAAGAIQRFFTGSDVAAFVATMTESFAGIKTAFSELFTGEIGLGDFASKIKTALSGIPAALQDLFTGGDFTALKTQVIAALGLDGISFEATVGSLKASVVAAFDGITWEGIGASLETVKTNIVNAANGIRDGILTAITDGINAIDWAALSLSFAGMIDWVTEKINTIDWSSISLIDMATALAGVIAPQITNGIKAIVWVFDSENWGPLTTAVKNAFTAIEWGEIGTSLLGLVTAVGTGITQMDWSLATTAFDTLKTGVINTITTIDWSTIGTNLVTTFNTLRDNLLASLTTMFTGLDLTTSFSTLLTSITTAITSINWGSLGVALGTALTAVFSPEGLKAIFDTAVLAIAPALVLSLAAVTWVFNSENFAGLVTSIGTAISGISWTTVSEKFSTLKTAITTALGDFASGFTEGFTTPEWLASLIAWPDLIPGWLATLTGWIDLVPGWLATLTSWIDLVPGWIATLSGWLDKVPGWLSTLESWLGKSPGWVSTLISGIDSFAAKFDGLVNKILGWVPQLPTVAGIQEGIADLIPDIPGLAGGTSFAQGGLTWVGERGPELVNMPRGSQVFNNSESMDMVRNSGGGGMTIIINVPDNSLSDTRKLARELAYEVATEIRRKGF